ncbi:hypothetical protein Mgra_00004927 [Meloidogyne graminicola]|uniref:S1 motif domain-containing protein n=1 Tax=Meloidogyne graminicola TaxID=189291 RepID=A0A8S9ZQE4_9BILA|nr:hypothetical protein Mgra_00004927 [Meloidogyne graminicola]
MDEAELDRLEHLYLVSRVITELENHFGLSDKGVAEFIIQLAKDGGTFDKFKKLLEENDLADGFDDSLVQHILRLVLSMERKRKQEHPLSNSMFLTIEDEKEELKEKIPALAMPNTKNTLMEELEGLKDKWEIERSAENVRKEAEVGRGRSGSRSPEVKNRRRHDHKTDGKSSPNRKRHGDRKERRRTRCASRFESPVKRKKLLEEAELFAIYDAKVNNITNFGAFAELDGFRKKTEGLIHISQIRNERVNAVADVLHRGQRIKVIKMDNSKLSLSMKEVNQENGEDLNPAMPKEQQKSDVKLSNPDAPWINPSDDLPSLPSTALMKRTRTPERWEFRQMQGGGAIRQTDLPDFDQELGIMKNYDEESDGEDVEIELVEDDPPLLGGYGRHVIDLEPVKVVKNLDESLAQAALMQGALSKERRDLKIQTQREKDAERQRSGLGRSRIHDPMAASSTQIEDDEEDLSIQKKILFFIYFITIFSIRICQNG